MNGKAANAHHDSRIATMTARAAKIAGAKIAGGT
jgi:hypothetical protein